MQREHINFSHLDYLTKSYRKAEHLAEVVPTEYEPFRPAEQCKPAPMYHEAWRLRCGAVVNLSWDEKQGAKLDMGGEALWNVREQMRCTDEFLMKLLSQSDKHKRTTRIDYAFNLVGWGSVNTLLRAYAHGRCASSFKRVSVIKSLTEKRGHTMYFGSKESDYRVRVYDKGAEMGNLWMAWVRCEAQFRGEYAQNAATDLGRGIELSSYTRTKISDSVDFPTVHWWREMMNGERAEITRLKHKESVFEKRMEQLLQEIVGKAEFSREQRDYIENQWLPALANKLLLTSQR